MQLVSKCWMAVMWRETTAMDKAMPLGAHTAGEAEIPEQEPSVFG
jgi:hypothetical protein